MYTHFKLTEFGERTVATVDGFPALLDVWYLKTAVLRFIKMENSWIGEPFDKAKYMVTDGTVNSNPANIIISFPPNKQITPTGFTINFDILKNVLYDLFDYVTYNDAVDRFKIISFKNVGELTFEGSNIYPNFEIMQYDIKLLQFIAANGLGYGYQVINYQVGNANGYNPQVYSFTLNILGETTLKNFSNSVETIDGISYYYGELEVLNGIPFATTVIEGNINLGAGPWYVGNTNEVYVNETPYQGNGTVQSTIVLNEEGKGKLFYTVQVAEIDLPVTGTIVFQLMSMNAYSDFISPTEYQVTENINF
jgi:hypothetical protein